MLAGGSPPSDVTGIPLKSQGWVNCRKTSAKALHSRGALISSWIVKLDEPIMENGECIRKWIITEPRDFPERRGRCSNPCGRRNPAPTHPKDPAPDKRKLLRVSGLSVQKLWTAGKPCTTVVDLKHRSYKVVLMLPPPYKRVRTYIDKNVR